MLEKINVGRRKTSSARVMLRSGNGGVTINGKALEVAFPQQDHRDTILSPFRVTETEGTFDLKVNVQGGGLTGQSEAIRLGVSRALCELNPDMRPKLKAEGYLTRDPRMVERKKYGQPKARKRFQFSKR